MPDVEVKLNILADYKAALAAIAQLAKGLEVVQAKAKAVLPTATPEAQTAGDDAKAIAERKKAVAELAIAMKAAAQTTEQMSAAIAKLSPALAQMGPSGEQVQQVAALSSHYQSLAVAMGQAADAAARYKAEDGGMKETDERIKKLLDENQQLMDLVQNIRAEYTEIVRRNAEAEREKKLRIENTQEIEKEKVANTDNTYQMQLASMTKRQLVAEIRRLSAARKEAAKAGKESDYSLYGEQLRIARQELRKLTQAQQVNKIAFLQQAQVAQQLGANLKTITEGVLGFGDALEDGTVNITGMASAAISMGMAIKAGLGPLGWALAAVELVSIAWNKYTASQREAEEQTKKLEEETRSAAKAAADAGFAYAEKLYTEDVNRKADIFIRSLQHEQEYLGNIIASVRELSAARADELKLEAQKAGDENTLKKLQLENDLINGKITATEKAIALKKLEAEEAAAADQLKLELAEQELETRRKIKNEISQTQKAARQTVEALAAEGKNMMSTDAIKRYEADRAHIEAELNALDAADINASQAERVENNIKRRYWRTQWERNEEKRDKSGRNTAAEYEAWKRKYQAALDHEQELLNQATENDRAIRDQTQEFNKLNEDAKRRATFRQKLAEAEEKNLRDRDRQTELDKRNKEKIDAIKNEVNNMTYAQLRRERNRLRERIKGSENERTRSRLTARMDVYDTALNKRSLAGVDAAEAVRVAGGAARGRAQRVVADAGNIAERTARAGKVSRRDIREMQALIQSAERTDSTADDAAVIELFNGMKKLMSRLQKDSKKMKQIENQVKKFNANID